MSKPLAFDTISVPAGSPGHTYAAYGLTFSSDLELPALRPAPKTQRVDAAIRRLSDRPEAPEEAKRLGSVLWGTPRQLSLRGADFGELFVEDGRAIGYHVAADAPPAHLGLFLEGSGMGALLMQRGFLVLHANAISFGAQAVLCAGHCGAGKSTTAAGLLQRGHPVLADDVSPIDDTTRVIPGTPRIKLWPESARHLGLPYDAGDLISELHPKLNLPLTEGYASRPHAVGCIIVIEPTDTQAVHIERLRGSDALTAVLGQVYRPAFVPIMGLQAAFFQKAMRLAAQVPILRLQRPKQGMSLEAVLDSIEAAARQYAS